MEKRLTAKNYFSVGMGLFGAALITALVTGYITYYSTNVLHITAMAIGNILLASRIFDGVTDLGMGVVLDKTNTK